MPAMDAEINICRNDQPDFASLAALLFEAVHAANLYTTAQRQAWSPAPRSADNMAERLAGQAVFLAETADRTLAGFMTLKDGTYVDFAYVRPVFQGRGLFRRLHEPLEWLARSAWTANLSTHASLHARPAFAALGYAVSAPETVSQSGQWLPRFHMEKRLVRG